MPRNDAFIQSLRAPFGKLDTTLPEARALVAVVGKLGLPIDHLQGQTTGQLAAAYTLPQMQEQGLNDSDQILLEMIIPPQAGGIDVAETIANFRADWQRGLYQLMVDVYENESTAMERAANAISNIPEVHAAAAAALKL